MDLTTPRHPASYSNGGRKRAGELEPALHFNLWPEDKLMPLSSLPALKAAKAAQTQGEEAFERMHKLLFQAYFVDNQDISDEVILEGIAHQAELNLAKFRKARQSSAIHDQIMQEYAEATDKYDINGVPTVLFNGYPMTGAVDTDIYRQAIKQLSKREKGG